jgi:DNA-binding response OmpR family regulator
MSGEMAAKKRHILIIDDSPLILEVARKMLEEAGYGVAIAINVTEFEAARRAEPPPDLIIVDIQMPEIFGDDLAQTIRGAYGEKAPIVFLSTLDEAELARRAEESGATAYVTKRAGMHALLAKVNELLASPKP